MHAAIDQHRSSVVSMMSAVALSGEALPDAYTVHDAVQNERFETSGEEEKEEKKMQTSLFCYHLLCTVTNSSQFSDDALFVCRSRRSLSVSFCYERLPF